MQFRQKQYDSPISALSKCVVSEQLAVLPPTVDYFVFYFTLDFLRQGSLSTSLAILPTSTKHFDRAAITL